MNKLQTTATHPEGLKTTALPLNASYGESDPGRSSLDVSKGSSWKLRTEVSKNQPTPEVEVLEHSLLPQKELVNTWRQRPVSTGPWSQPRTPSTGVLQTSKLPAEINYSAAAIKPSTNIPSTPERLSVKDVKSTQRSLSYRVEPKNETVRQDSFGQFKSTIASAVNSSQTIPSSRITTKTATTLPPPVNRADKPKILLKPSIAAPPGQRETSEPTAASKTLRVSPFSTPPNSDDSPVYEQPVNRDKSEVTPTQPGLSQTSHAIFLPPPSHHAVEAKRNTTIRSFSSRARRDPRANGSPETVVRTEDILCQRPGLPIRRDSNDPPSEKLNEPDRQNAKRDGGRSVSETRRPPPSQAVAARLSRTPKSYIQPSMSSSMPSDHRILSTDYRTMSRSFPTQLTRSVTDIGTTASLRHSLPTPADSGGSNAARDDGTISVDYPDASKANRRPPPSRMGVQQIETKYDTRLFDICGHYVCTTGYLTKAWDLRSGRTVMELANSERETKILSIAFKPGSTSDQEGRRIWLGSNTGDIQEVDLASEGVVYTKTSAHCRREIIKIYRHQNSMWSLDDDGRLYIWLPDDQGLPNLRDTPISRKVTKGHTFSIVVKEFLWIATGKEIRIYKPGSDSESSFNVQTVAQAHVGEVTSGAVISSRPDRVYFGHTDGKVTVYATANYACLEVVNVSVYKINSLAGAGFYIWAGYNTGMIYVYDTRSRPWTIKKDWKAHDKPVASILVDRSSVWKAGQLQVASIGTNNIVRLWDGFLEDDWLGMVVSTTASVSHR